MKARAEYVRDRRSPKPKDAATSAMMSRIKARDTTPERRLRAALRAAGLVGYRLHHAGAPGRPDVAFTGARVAVFVHGCFWHVCPHCRRRDPRHNVAFWKAKLEANRLRDQRKAAALRRQGWSVITVWECRLRSDADPQVRRIARMLARRS